MFFILNSSYIYFAMNKTRRILSLTDANPQAVANRRLLQKRIHTAAAIRQAIQTHGITALPQTLRELATSLHGDDGYMALLKGTHAAHEALRKAFPPMLEIQGMVHERNQVIRFSILDLLDLIYRGLGDDALDERKISSGAIIAGGKHRKGHGPYVESVGLINPKIIEAVLEKYFQLPEAERKLLLEVRCLTGQITLQVQQGLEKLYDHGRGQIRHGINE